jgi:DsbC/DsbD-like thiol-disulfide interchange protein
MAVLAVALTTSTTHAQGKKSDSVVKASAKADKIDADGKQLVTITLEVDAGWYIYCNPVGNEDFDSNKTTVTLTGKTKLESVKIDYPKGELVKDAVTGDYNIYKDKVTIKATVQRAKDDTSELEVTIKLQSCNKASCLLPATIKLKAK